MKKSILSALFGLSVFTTIAHAYPNDCTAPYNYLESQEKFRRQQQENLDRYPKQHHIHPDGSGGYYYFD